METFSALPAICAGSKSKSKSKKILFIVGTL